jgi:hypothetical protein
VAHEFGVSGHGDDRRPRRRAWTCPRSILSLTTGMRFRVALGPFLLGWRAHHHHLHFVRRPTEGRHSDATPTDDAQNRAPSLIYPILAWPSFADDIFRPTNYSPWPFSYQSIFDQAFAEYPAKRVADLCPRWIGKSDATLRIGREIAPTAVQRPLLQKLGTALAQANGYLIKFCPAEIPPLPVERLQLMDAQIDAMTIESFGVLSSNGETNIFPDIDRAIECAENSLLYAQPQLHRDEIPLAEIGLFAKFDSMDLAEIEPHLQRTSYQQGDIIFREGDPGEEVFIVTKGTASAFLQSPNSAIRLATFAPGTVFGELAILDAGPRSATVVADEDLVCFVLTMSKYTALMERHPSVAMRILAAIGRELSGRLRTANRTIHQLET